MREGHTVHLLIERLLDNLWSTLIQHAAHLNTSMNLALPSTVFADCSDENIPNKKVNYTQGPEA